QKGENVRHILDWRNERAADATLIFSNPIVERDIQKMLRGPRTVGPDRDLLEWIPELKVQYDWEAAFLLDSEGKPRFTLLANGSETAEHAIALAEQAIATRKPVFSDLHRSAESHPIHIDLAMPVLPPHPGDQATGVILLEINPYRFLYPRIQALPIPSSTAETLLVRREGNRVVYLNELRHHKDAALKFQVPMGTGDLIGARATGGVEGVVEGLDYRGVPVLAAVRKVQGWPWLLITKVDSAEIYEPIRQRAWFVGLIVALMIGGSAAVVGLLWRNQHARFYRRQYEAEIQLRQSQHFVRQILEATPNLLYIYDLAEQRNVYANREVSEFLGYAPEPLQQMRSELFGRVLHPDDAPRVAEHHARFVSGDGNGVHEIEYRMKHASGEWRWLHSRDVLFARSPDGKGKQILGACEDITERKQAQESLAWQLKLNEAVAGLAGALLAKSSIEEISGLLLERAKALTESPLAFVGHIDPKTGQLTATTDMPPHSQGPCAGQEFVFKERRGLCGWVAQNRQPLLTNDAPNDPRSIGTPPDHFPIRRFLSVPALAGESVVGQIAVANSGRDYTGRDLALVERMANLYALAIQRMHEEAALRKSEASLARAQRIARLGSWESDLITAGVEWSEEVYRIFGQPRTFRPTRDTLARLIHPDDREAVAAAVAESLATGNPYDIEHRIVLPDGSQRHVHEQAEVVMDDAGKPVRMIGTAHDVTVTRQLEEQLAHSQKMEAVGRLAGGVAHDFNNLLTVITGYCELSLAQLDDSDSLKENIVEIRRAGERAASLTGQLLAFSRRQMLQPQVLDLNSVVTGTERMLGRLIGEDIELVTRLNPQTGAVKVDAGQLQQVIMNLAVNARDAMPKGGKLTIETANAVLDETYVKKHIGVQPGPYVMIAVSDTGVGMDAETQNHIFEPFFTTKGRGKGTGLGLSTVYGIVKQSGGEVWVYSEPGKGTTFKIYLPRIFDVAPENAETEVADSHGTETILLVED
ncbi:MAG: PAS domain-containing protein, partial [Acidobacteria bacterium]|nr:PAS domain-containing protein [Acidobacteriota bacterium]